MIRLTLQIMLFFTATLFMESCNKENINPISTFYWNQTKGIDPWGASENISNTDTSFALKEFLEEKGINALKISFKDISDGNPTCDAPHCITGIQIFVDIAQKDNEKLRELGFKKL